MYRDRTALSVAVLLLFWKATVWPRHVVAEQKCHRGRAGSREELIWLWFLVTIYRDHTASSAAEPF